MTAKEKTQSTGARMLGLKSDKITQSGRLTMRVGKEAAKKPTILNKRTTSCLKINLAAITTKVKRKSGWQHE